MPQRGIGGGHQPETVMATRLSLLQRALGAALVAAVAPYALLRVLDRKALHFDADFRLAQDEVYDELFDGEVAAG